MNLYSTILTLCQEKDITPYRLAKDINISNSIFSDLKSGRKKSLSADILQKIADHFHVSVDYLLTGKEPTMSEQLRALFRRHQLSFNDVVSRTGVSPDKLFDFIKGKHVSISLADQEKIAKALGLNGSNLASELIFGEDGTDTGLLAIELQKKYDISAESAEKIIDDCLAAFQGEFRTEDESKIGESLWLLNDIGVNEAVNRVEELTEIPQYQVKTAIPDRNNEN